MKDVEPVWCLNAVLVTQCVLHETCAKPVTPVIFEVCIGVGGESFSSSKFTIS